MARLSTVLPGMLLITASQLALAQDLPTQEQYKQWDAKFKPGLYEFVDFELSADGVPKDEGGPSSQVCIDKTKALFMGRGKSFAAPMKSCTVNVVKLSKQGLIVGFDCSGPDKERPLLGTIVVAETAPDTFGVVVAKQVHAPNQSTPEPIYGVQHTFKRVGDCN